MMDPSIAYFSMEVAVDERLPTYSGGLGVLAGDHLRAAADLGLPVVAVTLLYRGGYFVQHLDPDGTQTESAVEWDPTDLLEPVDRRVTVDVCGHPVEVAAWRYPLTGVTGHVVPVYFLDTDVDGNDADDRTITQRLYGGDLAYRLRQEAVLGLGGADLLDALGHRRLRVYHMNEGHSALLTLSLADRLDGDGHIDGHIDGHGLPSAGDGERPASAGPDSAGLDGDTPGGDADGDGHPGAGGRPRCVFTTHTPVPAGHDRFPRDLVVDTLGDDRAHAIEALGGIDGGELDMTLLGMHRADFVNAVSHRHAEVTRAMFPGFPIHWITNGVHAGTWVAPAIGRLLDDGVPGWRLDNALLRAAGGIDREKLRAAHAVTKRALFDEVAIRTGVRLDPAALTVAVARRAAAYKRTDLLLSDPDRLRALVDRAGPLQIVYSGKAHPADHDGKALIERVVAVGRDLGTTVPVVYLEEYSMGLAGMLCAGVDLWVNTPVKPLEASGTSGMKAALNGVPSLSVPDGWWVEGHVDGVTGWAIGDDGGDRNDQVEATDLYAKLELLVAPLFYDRPDRFADVMRSCIALTGSYFNAERMVAQYARLAYRLDWASADDDRSTTGHRTAGTAAPSPHPA